MDFVTILFQCVTVIGTGAASNATIVIVSVAFVAAAADVVVVAIVCRWGCVCAEAPWNHLTTKARKFKL